MFKINKNAIIQTKFGDIMDINDIKKSMNPINLQGLNLELTSNCHLDSLINHFNYTSSRKKALVALEKIYFEMYSNIEKNNNNFKMQEDEDKVILDENSYFHILPANMETLKSISMFGLVASEWFGQLEKQKEACFCTFLNRFNSLEENEKTNNCNAYHNYVMYKTSDTHVWLFFDKRNYYMNELLKLDFFEYQRIRKTEKDKLTSLYPKEIIDIYENLILPMSPSSSTFHDNLCRTYFWSAIPGGIPPMLINGVCIGDYSKLYQELDTIEYLFPNATIFDGKRNILGYGKNKIK